MTLCSVRHRMIARPNSMLATAAMMLPGLVALTVALAGCVSDPARHAGLPRPEAFDADRYSGVWYEWARLPVFYQDDQTLAVAEYGPGDRPGRITVHNREILPDGNLGRSIRGVADMAPGDPPARFTVRFPGVPSIVAMFSGPNYHVLHVDPRYRVAVVGQPSRRVLWILGRQIPAPRQELENALAFARNAGFDTDAILVAPWEKVLRDNPQFRDTIDMPVATVSSDHTHSVPADR